ncbi:energy transducer TonB [Chryseobacterium vrystaatense]|uniref:TonB protein C-terminal n=1 Tax=Chryseobacterium vrystaatense TaxID=307480 RepID=A0A1M4ULI1_9FLAO|nr:hypothetical protein [Chryseobacterium vrystaatense]SHE57450.1 hypothetical protein SAMN02787073_0668 [Chryseobacterium vrystaatense]
MKKIVLLILFSSSITAYAQTLDTLKTPPLQDVSEKSKGAEYPGGMMKLRKHIAKKLKINKIKGIDGKKGILFSQAKFIVNIQGRIEGIVVIGDDVDFNTEVERAIKSLRTRWKPAEDNGVIVRSYYAVPFTLTMNN